jgi:tetratricopeptide (TPR) repeat protein
MTDARTIAGRSVGSAGPRAAVRTTSRALGRLRALTALRMPAGFRALAGFRAPAALRALAGVLSFAATLVPMPASAAEALTDEQWRALESQVEDARTAQEAARRLGVFLGGDPAPAQVARARYLEAVAQCTLGQGWDVINYSIARMNVALGRDSLEHATWLLDVAGRIAERDRMRDLPRQYAARAHRILPRDAASVPLWAEAWLVMGRVSLREGRSDSAVVRIERALPHLERAKRKLALFNLGSAHAARGDPDTAIGRFIESLVAEPAADTSVAIVLRAAWQAKHGSLEGLEERIAKTRSGD